MPINYGTNDVSSSGNISSSGTITATSGVFANLSVQNGISVNNTGVSISGHSHATSDITDFNSSVSGLVSGIYSPLFDQNLNTTDSVNFSSIEISGPFGGSITYDPNLNNGTLALSTWDQAAWQPILSLSYNSGVVFLDGTSQNTAWIGSVDVSNITNFNVGVSGLVSGIYQPLLTSPVAGIGSINKIPKWASSSGLTDSIITESASVLQISGSIRGMSDDTYLSFDSSTNRVGITKKNGFFSKLTYGSGAEFAISQSNTADILPTGTFTDRFIITSNGTIRLPGLTNNGFLKTGSSNGTVSVDTTSYQPLLSNPVTGTGISNHIAYWNSSSNIVSDSGQLYWDSTNNRLGVGTSSPTSQLHVIGTGVFSNVGATSVITINSDGRSIDANPSAFSDIILKANGENIFRGIDNWTGTWNDAVSTTYFQVGRSAGNTIFTSFLGNAFNRLAYSASKILFTNNTSNLLTPSGYFTINSNINGGSVGTSGLVIDTTHSSASANGQSHGALVLTPLFNTVGSNLNNIYGAYIAPRHSGVYTTTNSYALYVNATNNITGTVTNNYAAVFDGGNVGIRTATPSGQLHVIGSGIFSSGLHIISEDIKFSNVNSRLSWDNGTEYIARAPGTDGIVIATQSVAKVIVTSAGNVGINTTNPSQSLEVSGNIAQTWTGNDQRSAMVFNNDWRMGINYGAAARTLNLFSTSNDTNGHIIFSTRIGSGTSATDYGTERMRITSSGIGIGTSTPTGALHVIGSGIFASGITSTSGYLTSLNINNSSLGASNALAVNGSITTQGQSVTASTFAIYGSSLNSLALAGSTLRLSTNDITVPHTFVHFSGATPIERMRITGSGIGIGTTTPSGQLHVIGTGLFSQRVGIGTNSPSYILDVTGTGNFTQNLLVNGTGVSLSGHKHVAYIEIQEALLEDPPSALADIGAAPLSHTHISADITNFSSGVNSLVSGTYAPLNGATFTGAISGPSGDFTVLRQNGVNVSTSGHLHTSSNISDFNSSVSGLFPGSANEILYKNASGILRGSGDLTYVDTSNFLIMKKFSDDTVAPVLQLFKSRGSSSSPIIANTGDILGQIQFRTPNFNLTERVSSSIVAYIENSGSSSGVNASSYLTFNTSPGGGAPGVNPLERLRITGSGRVGIGHNSPSGGVHIKNDGGSWSSFNYSPSILIDGTRNNGIGFLDSSSSNPMAIVNNGGRLIFASMPSPGDTVVPPSPHFTITNTGTAVIGSTALAEASGKFGIINGSSFIYACDALYETLSIGPRKANDGFSTIVIYPTGSKFFAGQKYWNHSYSHSSYTTNYVDGSNPLASMSLSTAGDFSVSGNISVSGDIFSRGLPVKHKNIVSFSASDNMPPTTSYATLDTRNSILVLDFDAASTEFAVFPGMIPDAANLASGLKVNINWTASTATTGSCVWQAEFKDMDDDLDAITWGTAVTGISTTNATNGTPSVATISLSSAQIDGLSAGDFFLLRIARSGASASDTMPGDAELINLEVETHI